MPDLYDLKTAAAAAARARGHSVQDFTEHGESEVGLVLEGICERCGMTIYTNENHPPRGPIRPGVSYTGQAVQMDCPKEA